MVPPASICTPTPRCWAPTHPLTTSYTPPHGAQEPNLPADMSRPVRSAAGRQGVRVAWAKSGAAEATAGAASKTAGEQAWECGRLLIEAKKGVKHGEWLPWIKKNLTFGERQARNYMSIGEANRNVCADLSYLDALKQAADTKDTERIKREVAEEKTKRRATGDEPVMVYDLDDDDTEEVTRRKEQRQRVVSRSTATPPQEIRKLALWSV